MENNFKTANQLYKESGAKIPFSQWIEEQKQVFFIKNSSLNNVVQEVLKEQDQDAESTEKKPTQSKILGLSKPIIITSIVVIVSAIIYKVSISKK